MPGRPAWIRRRAGRKSSRDALRPWTRPGDARILGAMSSRIAVLAPFAPPSIRGNAITVARITAGLRRRGGELAIWDVSVAGEATVAREIGASRPTLLH